MVKKIHLSNRIVFLPISTRPRKKFFEITTNRVIPVILQPIPIEKEGENTTVFLLHHFFEKQTKKKGANHEKKEI